MLALSTGCSISLAFVRSARGKGGTLKSSSGILQLKEESSGYQVKLQIMKTIILVYVVLSNFFN